MRSTGCVEETYESDQSVTEVAVLSRDKANPRQRELDQTASFHSCGFGSNENPFDLDTEHAIQEHPSMQASSNQRRTQKPVKQGQASQVSGSCSHLGLCDG
jgi:hypothetical protein